MARAAATGGGRTYRGQTPVNWYISLVVICILGILSIAYSRYELHHPSTTPAAAPAVGSHWYEALGFDICGNMEPNLPANPHTSGPSPQISTTGDGLIDVSPTTSAFAGANATLGKFVSSYPGLSITATSLRYPGKPAYSNGDRCPKGTPEAGKAGIVALRVWSSPTASSSSAVSGNPADLHFQDGQLITAAFLPKGAPVPRPPAAVRSSLLTTLSGASSSTPTSTPATPTSTPATPTSTPATPLPAGSSGPTVSGISGSKASTPTPASHK